MSALIFPFTCSDEKQDFFKGFPAVVDLLDCANTAFHSVKHLLEKVEVAMLVHIQKPVDDQVFRNV